MVLDTLADRWLRSVLADIGVIRTVEGVTATSCEWGTNRAGQDF